MKEHKKVKEFVKKRYGKIASRKDSSCCSRSSEGLIEKAKVIGYTEKEIASIPIESRMGLGCGNPTALAGLKKSETVLDLGSGAGIDVFLASQKVGKGGYVIGVDMTPEMIDRSNKVVEKYGYKNVEFRLGEIESLPVEDESVDVIISNCVINLTLDKLTSYKEAYRVLKPNGRILISDLVTHGKLPEDIRQSFDAWAECISGAMDKEDYLNTIKKAGFREVAVVSERTYSEPEMDDRLRGKIISIQVIAYK